MNYGALIRVGMTAIASGQFGRGYLLRSGGDDSDRPCRKPSFCQSIVPVLAAVYGREEFK